MQGYITIIITIPLVLYFMGMVKSRHYNIRGAVKCFTIGIIIDYPTTILMNIMAGEFILNAHSIVGISAITLITTDLIIGFVFLKKRVQNWKDGSGMEHLFPGSFGQQATLSVLSCTVPGYNDPPPSTNITTHLTI